MVKPGDLVFSRWNGRDDWLITLGQRLRYGWRCPEARWTHVAIVTSEAGDLIEASGRGIAVTSLSNGEYEPSNGLRAIRAVDTGLTDADRAQVVAFAVSCVGQAYGFLTFAWIGLAYLTGFRLMVGLDGQEVCSGLAARALERGGFNFGHDARFVSPAELARCFHLGAPRP